ncbi:hypothetical protein [Pararhizobium qamdonense]|uniref:hypothetical protein n=1 Tax=Pararhizobium qamdonense TaxID=3031126 RepID=UPI0023E0A10D|nr:hypothetical protein [Pararhizobium qamdonense]
MNALNCLPKKTRRVLEELGDCWRLDEGAKHIRIFVNETMAGIVPKKVRGDGGMPGRSELNVIAQIRRAARGDVSNRRAVLAPAT